MGKRTYTYEVSFGESATGVRTRRSDGSYGQWLRQEGFHKVKRYNHRADGILVATKTRWQRRAERCFTSFRLRDDLPVPLLFSDELQDAIRRGVPVWLSESHSDAEALREAGVMATTNWGAAGSWTRGCRAAQGCSCRRRTSSR